MNNNPAIAECKPIRLLQWFNTTEPTFDRMVHDNPTGVEKKLIFATAKQLNRDAAAAQRADA
eukprot:3975179-Heterocapsa_arctica.AAC.1